MLVAEWAQAWQAVSPGGGTGRDVPTALPTPAAQAGAEVCTASPAPAVRDGVASRKGCGQCWARKFKGPGEAG